MGLRDKIRANLGQTLPPMITRSGNMFTLRDAAGNERPPVHTLDVVIVDGNGNVSKIYREETNYNPNDPLPPDCWSDNGEAPSSLALKPQATHCATCQWNIRGSATSKVDGKPIKACSDNQKLAVFVADDPQRILYQFVVTPGNLSAFRQYIKSLEGARYEPEEVVTRLAFVPKSTGLITFEPVDAIAPEMQALVAQTSGSGAAKFVTGEDDTPFVPRLAAPQQERQISARPEQRQEEPPKQEVLPPAEETKRPTREQLEATLAAQRAGDAPRRGRPPNNPAPAQRQPEPDNVTQIPAFLRRERATDGAAGMTSNAAPPPDEVSRLVAAHASEPGKQSLGERVTKAFGLPLRK